MSRAVVVGASMAGLLAARALSDSIDQVVVVERDEPPAATDTRRGVPQGRHAHALLAAGEQVITNWFPGIVDDLVAAGANRSRVGRGLWWQDGGFKVMGDFGCQAVSMSRPLLENTVRAHVGRVANITIRTGAKVQGLDWDDRTVVGVQLDDDVLAADLVVDCSGRSSRLVGELADAGFPEIPVDRVEVGITYGTTLLRRRPDDLPFDATYAVCAAVPPAEPRSAVLLPIEGDRWILTLAGMHGDDVPLDEAGFIEFARGLADPTIANLLQSAETLGPIAGFRYPASQRRRFERVDDHPAGYLALGDALCSFNPIYGQGMSSATLQAEALADAVERDGPRGPALAKRFYGKASKIVDSPWQIAVGGDFGHPATTGPKPPGTDAINRYVHHVHRATHVSAAAQERMLEVQSLLAPPTALMRPAFAVRVLWASWRHRRHGVTTPRWSGDPVAASPPLAHSVTVH